MKLPGFVKRPLSAGIAISFFGTLPIGVLNSCVFALSYSVSVGAGSSFASGAALVEMMYLIASIKVLHAFNWSGKQERWIYLGMTLLLATCTGYVAMYLFQETPHVTVNISRIDSPFLTGMSLSAANLLQIPFWMGWNLVLKNAGILDGSKSSKREYIFGSGIGTIAGFGVFILLGYTAQSSIAIPPLFIQYTIAIVFGITTIIAGIKCFMLFRKHEKHELYRRSISDTISG